MVSRLLLVLWALFVTVPAFAAQVQLVVPYRTLEVGQQGQVEVLVVNGRPSGVPRLEATPGLEVRYLSQARTSRIVNMTRTSTISFTYAVRATQEGTFSIGPARLDVDGQPMQSNVVELVVKAAAPPPDALVEAYASTSVDAAWEGQVVLYRYGLRSRVRVARVSWVALPLARLARPREGGGVRRQYVIDDPAGAIAIDEVWEPFLVTSGQDIGLEPAVAQLEIPVDDPRGRMRLFQPTETMTVATDTLTLRVQPLPPPPPGFTGLVGEFDIQGILSRPDAAVGDSLEWQIKVVGDGSLEGFKVPVAVDRPDVRFYDGSPSVYAEVGEHGYIAQGDFTRVVVPTRPGRLELPPLELVTFSTQRGAYVTHRLEVPPIAVRPGKEGVGELQSFAPADGDAMDDPATPTVVEFYPIKPSGRARVGFVAPWLLALAVAALGVACAPLLLEGAEAWRRRRPVPDAPAPPTPERLLQHLPAGGPDRLATLDEALREALRRRVAPDAARIERSKALGALPDALASEVRRVGAALDRARFAGDAPSEDLAEQVRGLVRALGEAT